MSVHCIIGGFCSGSTEVSVWATSTAGAVGNFRRSIFGSIEVSPCSGYWWLEQRAVRSFGSGSIEGSSMHFSCFQRCTFDQDTQDSVGRRRRTCRNTLHGSIRRSGAQTAFPPFPLEMRRQSKRKAITHVTGQFEWRRTAGRCPGGKRRAGDERDAQYLTRAGRSVRSRPCPCKSGPAPFLAHPCARTGHAGIGRPAGKRPQRQ